MAGFTRSQWAGMAVGFQVVPTLMVIVGHPWLGAATLGGVLTAFGLQTWMSVRAEQDRNRTIWAYTHDTSGKGDARTVMNRDADPEHEPPAQLPPRSHAPRRHQAYQPPGQTWLERPPRA